jgi:endonuclease YncB( thermonuclease family)
MGPRRSTIETRSQSLVKAGRGFGAFLRRCALRLFCLLALQALSLAILGRKRMQTLLAVAATLAASACSPMPTSPPASIVGAAAVTDGDTIRIDGVRIRLDGYDAPERGKTCGEVNVYESARAELDRFIAGREVTCRIVASPDRYGREIAQCSVGGVDFGDHMVSQGWSRDWPRFSHGRYAGAEAQARRARRGLWGLACSGDVWSGRDYSTP